MLKKIYLAALMYGSLFSTAAFSYCSNALPTDDPNFCASFKLVAKCYCTSSGLPAGMCEDMNQLALRLKAVFGSLEKACKSQKYTNAEDCMDNWNCYLNGGVDSRNRICSSNYRACL
jgi:hypothetical protein